jgi:hypothetical protein
MGCFLLLHNENDSSQQRGQLNPNMGRNGRRRSGLALYLRCHNARARGPSLHPGRHAATEKEGQPQTLATAGRSAPHISAQLLVMPYQILPGNRRVEGFPQRGFF